MKRLGSFQRRGVPVWAPLLCFCDLVQTSSSDLVLWFCGFVTGHYVVKDPAPALIPDQFEAAPITDSLAMM